MKRLVVLLAVALLVSAIPWSACKVDDQAIAVMHLKDGVKKFNDRHFEDAVLSLDLAVRRDPGLADAYFYRSSANLMLEKVDLALQDLDQAISLSPQHKLAYGVRAMAYGKQGDYGKAIEDFDKAVAIDPQNAKLYSSRGFAHLRTGQLDRFGRGILLPRGAKQCPAPV